MAKLDSFNIDKREINGKRYDERPPSPVDTLIEVCKKSFSKHRPCESFPSEAGSASRLWLDLMEPMGQREIPVNDSVSSGREESRTYWKTPYTDRLVYTLRKFLNLKHIEQEFVLKHIHDGIPWRGDDMKMYSMIVDEHRIMTGDNEAYIANAKSQLKRMGLKND